MRILNYINLFFKHDKPDDYKEYIQYITDIKDNKTHNQYDFTESCKTDFNIYLSNKKKYFKELKIKTYEIKFKHKKLLKVIMIQVQKLKNTYNIFLRKNKFNCLIIYETYIDIINKVVENVFRKRSREYSKDSKYFEENKINKLFEELIKDFKLYTKRCEAYNCNYSNEDTLKKKKKSTKIKQNILTLIFGINLKVRIV
jgi:hypothetical protein